MKNVKKSLVDKMNTPLDFTTAHGSLFEDVLSSLHSEGDYKSNRHLQLLLVGLGTKGQYILRKNTILLSLPGLIKQNQFVFDTHFGQNFFLAWCQKYEVDVWQ
ncbi:hypothetical protein ILYODFUR_032315 [Ilyodon furcidens]|uniref:Uncharacterized protein n=1 Tax=Ilyodon furcidens TaxID=33524 RepID=A0ABV0SQZ1_9TELE